MGAQLLPSLVIVFATTALPLALHVYRRGSGRGVTLLVVLLLAMSEWALAYALELLVTALAVKVFWARAWAPSIRSRNPGSYAPRTKT
jgi:lipopolysaccharide export LptBFGC system permease protein LptF